MEYLDDDNFKDVFRNVKNVTIFLKFTASWCGACVKIDPYLKKMAQINTSSYFYKVDVDDSPFLADYFEIRALPTFIAITNGMEMDRVLGANQEELAQLIAKYK